MAEKLSEEQVAEFKEAFDRFDKDKDGTITVQELGTVMQELCLKPSEAELKVLIARLDTDNNGVISFQEFLEAMATGLQTSVTEEGLRDIFRAFDQDNDGYISVDELRQATAQLGEKLSQDELDAMIREADVDQDGRVNYEEFVLPILQSCCEETQTDALVGIKGCELQGVRLCLNGGRGRWGGWGL
uniref:EF-hand domain-containing protein n=1 Tax=Moschus moschiferus TaxID=68415 RepID=A0A8C6DYB3_MOSMO